MRLYIAYKDYSPLLLSSCSLNPLLPSASSSLGVVFSCFLGDALGSDFGVLLGEALGFDLGGVCCEVWATARSSGMTSTILSSVGEALRPRPDGDEDLCSSETEVSAAISVRNKCCVMNSQHSL
jgi:hypothetical protein